MTGGWPAQRPQSIHELSAQSDAPDVPDLLALLERFRKDGNLLYVGPGTGRRALPLAAAGWAVYGVEPDEAAVAALRERTSGDPHVAEAASRLEVEVAPLEKAACTRRFDVVLAPDAVLNYPPTWEEQAELLAACADRCRPGGIVVADVLNPLPFFACITAGRAGPVSYGGGVGITELGYQPVWSTADYYVGDVDTDGQRFDVSAVYRIRWFDGEVREYVDRERLRWVSPQELRMLAARAGLDLVNERFAAPTAPAWRVVLRNPAR